MDKDKKDIVINLINRIFEIGEMILPEGYEKEAKGKAKASIITEIVEDQSIPALLRYDFVDKPRKYVKEYRECLNKQIITQGAVQYLTNKARPEDVNVDWLIDFFDRAGKISEDGMRSIWSKILGEEVNSPGKVPKRLLHALFMMDAEDAKEFQTLTGCCLRDKKKVGIYHPFIYIRDYASKYETIGIDADLLSNMKDLGLIEYDYERGFAFDDKKVLLFDSKKIILKKEKIFAGNVKMTKSGNALASVIEASTNIASLDEICAAWEKQNIEFEISDN